MSSIYKLEKYKQAAELGEAVLIEKKSKFIATVSPVETEEEAQRFISALRKKYWDAGHNVFAYQLGLKNEIQRQSDDGEPSGTGGTPLMELLKTNQLYNSVIVVTRYFGGILLGTGGLTRAYGQAAQQGLLNAGILEKKLCQNISLDSNYSLWGRIQYEAQKRNYHLSNVSYADNVCAEFLIENSRINEFSKIVTELTNAQVGLVYGEFEYKVLEPV